MKKMTLFALLLCVGALQAQISFEGMGDFAKLADLTYDDDVPDRLYALTVGNHIVESVDNGATWSVLYSFPRSEAYLTGLKLQGSSALSFVVNGTHSQTDGVYILDIATTALLQHYQVPGVAQGAMVISYDIQGNGQQLLAHTTVNDQEFGYHTQVFYSADTGQHWDSVYYSAESNYVHVYTVAISPDTPSRLFIARSVGSNGVDGGLLISDDGGESWTEKLPGNTFRAIAFNPENADDILLGTGAVTAENLYRSADGGDTWSVIPIAWEDIGINDIAKIAFHPTSPNHIIVLEENEILLSDDGGQSWNHMVYPQDSGSYSYGTNASFSPSDPQSIAVSCDTYSRITDDGGVTLTAVQAPYYAADNVAYGTHGTDGQLYHGTNGGRISKDLSTGISTAYDTAPLSSFMNIRNYIFAHPTLPGTIISYEAAGLLGGTVKLSTDFGATVTTLSPAQADDIQGIAFGPDTDSTVYIALRSAADGQLLKINYADPQNIIAEIIETPILGADGEGTGVITGVAVTQTNTDEIYIAKKSKFLKSSDGGMTWEEKETGIASYGGTIILDMQRNPLDPDHFAIVTNVGLFTSGDAGEHWTILLEGQGYRSVKYSPVNNGVLVVSSYSAVGGISAAITYTADAGATWTTIANEALDYISSYSMDYSFQGDQILAFIASTDLGVVRYTISDIELGLPDYDAAKNPFVVYPNPAQDEITVGTVEGNSGIRTVSLYSITGEKLLESTQSSLDVRMLSKGIYLIMAEDEEGRRYSQKLIKE